MDIAEPVMWSMREPPPGTSVEGAIEDAVLKLSLENLRTFPWIRDAERERRLVLSAWRFSLATGELSAL
jgi:carbonic anhydrase